MANELQGSFVHNSLCYFLIRDRNGQIWNTVTNTFGAYATGSYSGYTITATEQGTASAFFVGSVPAAVPPGAYGIIMKQQLGASAAETDTTVDVGNLDWNGTNVAQLSDIAVSGVIAPITPMRGWMIKNFPLKLVSSADHLSPFTSGIVSGQISKDGGAFTALQSGAFTELGHGWYTLQALTSGDMLANTIALVFTANGVSGGSSDQRDFGIVTQRSSGQ